MTAEERTATKQTIIKHYENTKFVRKECQPLQDPSWLVKDNSEIIPNGIEQRSRSVEPPQLTVSYVKTTPPDR